MGRSKCPTKGGNWEGGFTASPKVWTFPFCCTSPLTKTLSHPFPPLIADHISEKKLSLIVFRQILPKHLSVAYIFSNTVMTNLKNLIGNKSLNTKQCPAGLSLRVIPLNLHGKHWGCGRIPTNNQKFTYFLHQKSPP